VTWRTNGDAAERLDTLKLFRLLSAAFGVIDVSRGDYRKELNMTTVTEQTETAETKATKKPCVAPRRANVALAKAKASKKAPQAKKGQSLTRQIDLIEIRNC
jgi:hypothetical protein